MTATGATTATLIVTALGAKPAALKTETWMTNINNVLQLPFLCPAGRRRRGRLRGEVCDHGGEEEGGGDGVAEQEVHPELLPHLLPRRGRRGQGPVDRRRDVEVGHHQGPEDRGHAGAQDVAHLVDGGGGGALRGREPGGRDGGRGGHDGDAGDAVQDGPKVGQRGEGRVRGEGGVRDGAGGHQGAHQQGGAPEAEPPLGGRPGDGGHEEQEGDGAPVRHGRDGGVRPPVGEAERDVHRTEGVPRRALDEGHAGEGEEHPPALRVRAVHGPTMNFISLIPDAVPETIKRRMN